MNRICMMMGRGAWVGRRLELVIPIFFVDFPAGLLHGLTSRVGLTQGDTDVFCPLGSLPSSVFREVSDDRWTHDLP